MTNNWINPKKQKPKLGQKILIKFKLGFGNYEYNVAIYAINGNDKRKTGFFENYDNKLSKDNVMKYDSWEYQNVIGWTIIEK